MPPEPSPEPAMCCGYRGGLVFKAHSITQLKAQGPSRTCNESKEEEGLRIPPPGIMFPLMCIRLV